MLIDIALISLVGYLVIDVEHARKEARENWAALAKKMDIIRWEKGLRGREAAVATDSPE